MNLLARARKQDRPIDSSSDPASGTAASIINAYKLSVFLSIPFIF
jgi:hypothetical protein